MTLLEELFALMEGQRDDRLEFVKNQVQPKWEDGHAGFKTFDAFLKAVDGADPSEKGVYMQWIARLIVKNPDENAKGLKNVHDALQNFERFKNKLEKKDINAYKSFDELFTAVKPFEFLKDAAKKFPEHGIDGAKTLDDLVRKVSKNDPTPDQKYVPWMINMILKAPKENRVEDLERLKADLTNFEKHKGKHKADIEKMKSFEDVYTTIEPHLDKDAKEAANEAREFEKMKDEITLVYEGPDGWIRIPNSVRSASFLGQSTRWCTAAKNGNMFSHYNKTDKMFVVYDKASKKRSQLHIQSGQFANEADANQGTKAVPEWAREPIYQWYKKNNPQLTIKQLLTLSDFTKENPAEGTDHEDLINLMKKYGV